MSVGISISGHYIPCTLYHQPQGPNTSQVQIIHLQCVYLHPHVVRYRCKIILPLCKCAESPLARLPKKFGRGYQYDPAHLSAPNRSEEVTAYMSASRSASIKKNTVGCQFFLMMPVDMPINMSGKFKQYQAIGQHIRTYP